MTNQQLTEALQLIQYDVHREVQGVIREQVRQFSIAKVSPIIRMRDVMTALYIAASHLRSFLRQDGWLCSTTVLWLCSAIIQLWFCFMKE